MIAETRPATAPRRCATGSYRATAVAHHCADQPVAISSESGGVMVLEPLDLFPVRMAVAFMGSDRTNLRMGGIEEGSVLTPKTRL
jgi:hypothetical protein